MEKYWRVAESISGWRIYNVPVTVCKTEKELRKIIQYGEAEDYIAETAIDYTQIESVELEEEE